MFTRMQQRRGTAAQWAAANPILTDGEIGFEKDTEEFKIGDGVSPWADLNYIGGVPAPVITAEIEAAIEAQATIDNATFEAGISRVRYVNSATGSDANDGLTMSKAKATLQAAVTAAGDDGTVRIAPGTYAPFTTSAANLLLEGMGGIGQDPTTGDGSVIVVVPSGQWGCELGVGAGSEIFRGFEMRRIYFKGAAGALGGVRVGKMSNFLIDRIGCGGFPDGTGIFVEGSGASQCGTIRDPQLMDCKTGLDVDNHNGLRLFGGTVEYLPGGSSITAGTTGVKIRSAATEFRSYGAIVQFQETGFDLTGADAEISDARVEACTTGAKFRGADGTWRGGKINNFITGATGTGIEVVAGATDTRILPFRYGSLTNAVIDAGTRTYRGDGIRVEKVAVGTFNTNGQYQTLYTIPSRMAGLAVDYKLRQCELRLSTAVAASGSDYWTINLLIRGTDSQVLQAINSQAGWAAYTEIVIDLEAGGGLDQAFSPSSTFLIQFAKTGSPAAIIDPQVSFALVPR
jgi:hypothetical protein